MNTPSEIRLLARQRLSEANVLCKNGHYDGAFYLAGYSVELALKAKICELFGVPNLFDESLSPNNSIKGIREIRRFAKTHDLYVLLISSGLLNKFENEIARNYSLSKCNSLLFGNWTENVRYKPCSHITLSDVEDLITLLSDSEGFLKWIERN
ncbi:MAG: HEPN domain-containing protein [Bacteroidia bacterium]|jgi:HEPN domain-containing protein|nr:HEPN domain-containing protein [Bacteroidia bacterium]